MWASWRNNRWRVVEDRKIGVISPLSFESVNVLNNVKLNYVHPKTKKNRSKAIE